MRTKNLDRVSLGDFVTSPELAEVKVVYKSRPKERVKVRSSRDAYEIFYQIFDKDTIEYQEQFYLLLLNRANMVIGWVRLSQGGMSGTVVDPKVIFSIALTTCTTCLVLCHNHPSGSIIPSEADLALTKSLGQAGKLLEITVLDHLIIGQEGCYYSFADEGII
ncbi:MAG: JAB domain-containing protein [Bacteroidota bacterium]